MSSLLSIVTGFASGIFLRSLFFTSWTPIIFAVMLAALLSAAAFYRPRAVYTLSALFCVFVALGMMRATIADTPLQQAFVDEVGKRVSYDGVVVADPDVRDANQRVQIRVSKGDASTVMLAVAPRYPSAMVGDKVFVSGTLEVPEAFADDGGRTFRYDKYLQRDGVRFILSFAYIRVQSHAPWYSLPAALAKVKHTFIDGIRATLPEPHASLAGGIVIGGKSGLGNELKEQFMRSGLIHMVVLSGHNVMVVATWVIAFFAFLFARIELIAKRRVPRLASIVLGVVALILFVGIAGFSTTAIRAMLMALIALYARATGRTYAAGRALLVVVFLMLLWNPLFLVFDPGFGLSVVATAGLIWLAPIVEHFLRIKNVFLREVVVTTIAAQVAVLPLLLYFTGTLSLVSLPANLLVMPFVPLAMGLSYLAGFAGMLFSSIAPILGIVIAFPAYVANSYLAWVAETAAALPFAAFALPLFPFWLVLIAYAALIFIASSKRFSTTDQFTFAKKASM